MTSFFSSALGGNPFSTAVGGKIEKATDASLASENWALNMEICDLINESEEAARDAMKAIRKRLTQNAGKNYNYTVVMYTLTVLETCVKNCGKKFHLLVCSKDFVQELVKLIGPKNDPPTAVQEKVLSLIQAWADAFISQPDLSGVVLVYQDLRSKGIEFPSTDLDCLAPIHTPEKTVKSKPPVADITDGSMPTSATASISTSNAASASPDPAADLPPGAIQGSIPQGAPMAAPIIISPVAGTLTADQRAKLQSELDVVQANMAVLGEMLSELTPGKEMPDELDLLQELHVTCHSMQSRVVELIGRLANDELTADLLRINDDLNNLFLRYTRFEKNRGDGPGMEHQATGATPKKMIASGTSPSAVLGKAMSAAAAAKKAEAEGRSLIDWGSADEGDREEDVVKQLSKMGVSGSNASAQLANVGSTIARNGPQGDTDEFDMFAQSRTTTETSKVGGSSKQPEGSNILANPKNKNRELEFDEIAAWLDEEPGGEESVTSTEFDRFLAERAAAADSLPSVTTTTNTSTNKSINSKDEKQIQLL